jgi:hypothetical protein
LLCNNLPILTHANYFRYRIAFAAYTTCIRMYHNIKAAYFVCETARAERTPGISSNFSLSCPYPRYLDPLTPNRMNEPSCIMHHSSCGLTSVFTHCSIPASCYCRDVPKALMALTPTFEFLPSLHPPVLARRVPAMLQWTKINRFGSDNRSRAHF